MKMSEKAVRSVIATTGVALVAVVSAAHVNDRLWREQVHANASGTMAVTVIARGDASTAPAYVWKEQLEG